MVKVYGCSDDLVEIEGSSYKEDEIGCYRRNVRLFFEDGTVVLIGYGKVGFGGVWWINYENKGNAYQTLSICEDEDADIYSDILCIDSEIKAHETIDTYDDY